MENGYKIRMVVIQMQKEFTIYSSQEMKNECRRFGKFKNSEFAFQTSWYDDGEQASRVAHEPCENSARCLH
jgi:hypothetical protein